MVPVVWSRSGSTGIPFASFAFDILNTARVAAQAIKIDANASLRPEKVSEENQSEKANEPGQILRPNPNVRSVGSGSGS